MTFAIRSFGKWGMPLKYSLVLAGIIQSCDVFRTIADERKYIGWTKR